MCRQWWWRLESWLGDSNYHWSCWGDFSKVKIMLILTVYSFFPEQVNLMTALSGFYRPAKPKKHCVWDQLSLSALQKAASPGCRDCPSRYCLSDPFAQVIGRVTSHLVGGLVFWICVHMVSIWIYFTGNGANEVFEKQKEIKFRLLIQNAGCLTPLLLCSFCELYYHPCCMRAF